MWNFRETPSTLDVSYERLARLPDFSGNTLSNCAAEENSIVFGLVSLCLKKLCTLVFVFIYLLLTLLFFFCDKVIIFLGSTLC